MLFNSLAFLFFFFIISTLYFTMPERFQWKLLLIGSYIFYISWEPGYAILLALLTLFNYYLVLYLGKSRGAGRKRALLLGIVSNAGLLFWFKYLNFFIDSLKGALSHYTLALAFKSPAVSILLPVGISFYTFKILNYIIDVYRGHMEPERKLGLFALYVSFFPQLIAGPIDRAAKLLPQFHEKHGFDYQRVTGGLKLMMWGFFQKLVIADNLSVIVDRVYNNPLQYEGLCLVLATVLFTFQIYCDFSGYSDIAIGIARVFGYQSMINFDRPYFSASIPEFWRRWHISLSSWFRDYLYIPLGGNRVPVPQWYANLLIVFIISGLWHGASWTFIAWGCLHGCFCIASALTSGLRNTTTTALGLNKIPQVHQGLKIMVTFCLVSLAWIFFRANTISDAFYIFSRLFTGWGLSGKGGLSTLFSLISSYRFEFFVGIISVAVMELIHLLQGRGSIGQMLAQRPAYLRWTLYYGALAAILLLGNFGSRQFIYFQF
ncbi:MAG: membrane-bound O-acyltransferase family protein [Syntrophus sp. (in: bacteria)]|nr:membrane-bound O-acyltransferase family protein [Syntrophus sp. (in: bacteria)]